MTREGIDEGRQEGVLGEVWFEVTREDKSKVRKGVISGTEEVDGEMMGKLWRVAECVMKAVAKIQDSSFGPEGGDGVSNVVE